MTNDEYFQKCIEEFKPNYFDDEPTRIDMAFSKGKTTIGLMLSPNLPDNIVVFTIYDLKTN